MRMRERQRMREILEKRDILAIWYDKGYDTCLRAFRKTFGYDYQGKSSQLTTLSIQHRTCSITEEQSLMDKDVKKASMTKLRELKRNLVG